MCMSVVDIVCRIVNVGFISILFYFIIPLKIGGGEVWVLVRRSGKGRSGRASLTSPLSEPLARLLKKAAVLGVRLVGCTQLLALVRRFACERPVRSRGCRRKAVIWMQARCVAWFPSFRSRARDPLDMLTTVHLCINRRLDE